MTDTAALSRAREKLIVALDVPSVAEARALVEKLGDAAVFYKIGLRHQLAGGDAFAKELIAAGKKVFLDYKYFDIGETMRAAVAKAAELGVSFLTVHGVGDILRAAAAGRQGSNLRLLCVTVLTSLDADDMKAMGYPCDVEELVLARAQKALEAGCDGVVASPLEAPRIRALTKGRLSIVTPGVRPAGGALNDQKRVATPAEALRAGADYLVVGRPILAAADPVAATRAILAEMAQVA